MFGWLLFLTLSNASFWLKYASMMMFAGWSFDCSLEEEIGGKEVYWP
jgi:hypothetical protein